MISLVHTSKVTVCHSVVFEKIKLIKPPLALQKSFSKLALKPRHVFITHGEENVARNFQNYLREKTGFDTSVPAYNSKVRLE